MCTDSTCIHCGVVLQVYVSHGVQDKVLPINRCSRVIVPKLKAADYSVVYKVFPEGHCVPHNCINDAMKLLLQNPSTTVNTIVNTTVNTTAATVTSTADV
jgi:hypothetical protein